MQLFGFLVVWFLAALLPALAIAGPEGAPYVFMAHGKKIAHVEIIGTLFNNSTEVVQAGSGLRVSQPYVLTSGHLFALTANYKSIEINVRFGSRKNKPYQASMELRDLSLDLALLRIDGVPEETGCPFFLVTNTSVVPAGSDLYFLGFPIDGPLRISPGIMSTDPDPSRVLWESNAPINPGDSGAPSFTRFGYLAGIAKGVLSEWHVGDQVTRLVGITQFVSAPQIQASEIGRRIFVEQVDVRCLRANAMNDDGSLRLAGGALAPIDPPGEFSIAQAIAINWNVAKEMSSERRVLHASPGYSVKRCSFEPIKVVGVMVSCAVASDGKSVNVDLSPIHTEAPRPTFVAGRVVLDQFPIPQ